MRHAMLGRGEDGVPANAAAEDAATTSAAAAAVMIVRRRGRRLVSSPVMAATMDAVPTHVEPLSAGVAGARFPA